jgi:MEDS: MEthanogen/methylotroph, DcmR Sensory domain
VSTLRGLGTAGPWQHTLVSPAAGQHIAMIYTEPGFLVRAVTRFVADGLGRNEGAIVIVTPFHWQAIASRLLGSGFEPSALIASRQLSVVDAAVCLESFLVAGVPDRDRFRTTIGTAIETANAAGYARLRAVGQMVDLLRRRDPAAALRLEQWWNEVVAEHGLPLLCAYSFDNFDSRIHRGFLQGVSAEHSDLIPVEDYARLERAVQSAYLDVFGPDGPTLRRSLEARYAKPATMPAAEAAILAARELVPTVADAVLERARWHYRAHGSTSTR